MNRQIYVGRLSSKATREDLQKEFEHYGKIRDIDLRHNRAFVEYEQGDDAREALEKMDGKRICGERISCKPRGRKDEMKDEEF